MKLMDFIIKHVQPQIEEMYSLFDVCDVGLGYTMDDAILKQFEAEVEWSVRDFHSFDPEIVQSKIDTYVDVFWNGCNKNQIDGIVYFKQRVTTFEDPLLLRQQKTGWYGWMEIYTKE